MNFKTTLALLFLTTSLGLASTGLAQTAGPDDLRALRFYLQQNDQPAAQAELRRLRLAFPEWTPPANLNDVLASPQAAASVDEAAIWREIERRDYSSARRLIEEGRSRIAGWTPPSDMLRVLETNEAQDNFTAAVNARDATRAIAIARGAPQLMSCERINNAWLLADMYKLAGQNPAAIATYRNTLQSCTSYNLMQTTLEKSSEIASGNALRDLFSVARSANPAARPQLDALETRLTGGAAPTPAPASAPVQTARATPAAPAASAAPVATAPTQPQVAAQLAPVAPGRLPLRGDSRISQVRQLKEREQYAQCLAASQNPRSLDVLYERSWCAFSHQRPSEALVGFQAAAQAGDSIGPNVRRDAHFGMALSLLSMNMTEQGAAVASQVRLADTQHREIEGMVLDQRGVRAYRAGDYRQAIGFFNQLEQTSGSLRRDLAILRAYAYLNAGQVPAARAEFERLHAQLATAETRQGLSAAR